jgi:hypothetical protein
MAEENHSKTNTPAVTGKHTGMSSGKRVAIGLNVILQALIVFAIVIAINFVSFRRFKRWDYSRNQTFALSSQTTSLLGSLQKPVQVIIYFSGSGGFGQIYPDTIGLLREYEYASKRKLTVEQVDPYRNPQRANELIEKYKISEMENIVIVDYDGKSKFVEAKDMADIEGGGMNPFNPQPPQVKAFKGEAAVTSALLELVEGKAQKLYYTTGHGEVDIVEQGKAKPDDASVIGEMFKRSNIKYEKLGLMDSERVPEDATSLLIFGPKQDFTEREIGLLNDYWNNKGRVSVLLRGNVKTPRLAAWLAQNGVTVQPGRIFAQAAVRNPLTGERLIQVVSYGAGTFTSENKNITGALTEQNATFPGPTAALDIDRSKQGYRFNVLAQSAKQFWLDVDPFDEKTAPERDPAREKEGPFTLAVAVEKGGVEGVKVDTSRMIVVANAEFLTDGGLQQSSDGLEFGLNGINWALSREQSVGVGIPPKEKKLVALTLDESEQRKLALGIMGALPGLVAVFGFISWFQRRR